MGRDGLPQGRAELLRAGVPAYIFPESAARALAALRRHREWRARPEAARPALAVDRAAAAALLARRVDGGRLAALDALRLLEAYGLRTAPARLAADVESAVRAAAELGYPVALKADSPDVVHKTEAGGVRLDLATAVELREACVEMADAVRRATGAAPAFLVQRMVAGGRETIVGIARDAVFGPLVMFGLGGILVEVLRDVTFRMAPLGALDAHDLIHGIRGLPLLKGVRGSPPVDFASLTDAVLRVAQLAVDFPAIAELDVNPLLAFPDRAIAVDARVLVATPGAHAGTPD
jgi:acetyltransferase